MLFFEIYEQANVLDEDRSRAFSLVLTRHSRQFYFDYFKQWNISLVEHEVAVKSRLFASELTKALMRQWNALTLITIMISKADESPSQFLELLIKNFFDIHTFSTGLLQQTDLENKLQNSIKFVDAFKLAYYKLAVTVHGVISDSHASRATLKTHSTNAVLVESSANFVDRRLVQKTHSKTSHTGQSKKCFVRTQTACLSTNHLTKERLQSYQNQKSDRQLVHDFLPSYQRIR